MITEVITKIKIVFSILINCHVTVIGATFCNVIIIRLFIQFRFSITLIIQNWKGAEPILSIIVEINI